MEVKQRFVYSLIALFFIANSVQAQPINGKFQNITEESGLSHPYVFSIEQDQLGYLWIGTWDGLNRYNGYEFEVYKPDPQNPNSLSNNCVTTIFKDQHKTLWIGTNGGGLNKISHIQYNKEEGTYNIEKDEIQMLGQDIAFQLYRHNEQDQHSISNDNITAICEDDFGNIWIGTYGGGLNKYVTQNGNEKFIHYQYNDEKEQGITNNYIKDLYKDRTGMIWVASEGGLFKCNPLNGDKGNEQFVHYTFNPANNNGLPSNKITQILEDRHDHIWVGTWGKGIAILTKVNKKKTPGNAQFINLDATNSDLSNNMASSLLEDHNGNIWIGTLNGLNYIDIKSKQAIENKRFYIQKFQTNPDDPQSLSSNQIETLYQDHSGVLWVGTQNGVSKINLEMKRFMSYPIAPNTQNALVDRSILSIYQDYDKNTYIGSESGVLSIIKKNGNYRHFFVKNGNINLLSKQNRRYFSNQEDIQNGITQFIPMNIGKGDFVNSISGDPKGNIWIGSVGLYKYNQQEGFTYYNPNPGDESTISGLFVWDTYTDRKGNIWIATNNGLNKYVHHEDKFYHYYHEPGNDKSISSNKIWTILEDRRGNIWLGTDKGLDIIHHQNQEQQLNINHISQTHQTKILGTNKIWSLQEDRKGRIWVGTEGGGLHLLKLDINNQNQLDSISVKTFNEKMGLSGNIICGILENQQNGNIWVSTTKGLSRIHSRTYEIQNYYTFDGLQSNNFNKGGAYKNESGKMFFGSDQGLNWFFPDSIHNNPTPPKVILTDLKIYNQSIPIGETNQGRVILDKPLWQTKEIELSYNDDVITFDFVALHYQQPSRNKYKYKLEPFDKEWIIAPKGKRHVSYSNIPSGKYRFRVVAANSDGLWNNNGATIRLHIHPPFYATWWAYTIYVLLFGLTLYLIRFFTLNRERLRTKLKLAQVESSRREEMLKKDQELNQLKLKFFTNISHEFRTPLTLILGPIENLLKSTKENKKLKSQIELIYRNASHLLRLVNQLIDFRKLEMGGIHLKAAEYDLPKFVEKIFQSFKYLAHQRKISFEFETSDPSIQVYFDKDMLEKIIYNLLSNAFKFTPEQGKIKLKIQKKSVVNPFLKANKEKIPEVFLDGYVDIIVEDNGDGIEPDKLEKIFDRFYQVKNAADNNTGSGIGLALTKELVELHQGQILAESEKGTGTSFKVRLPLGKKHLSESEIIEAPANDPDVSLSKSLISSETETVKEDHFERDLDELLEMQDEKPLILVVEDNPDLRTFIETTLGEEFTIEQAENGSQGIEKAIDTIPDLIISDIMMPDKDGYELCETLKNNVKTSHIPIIMLTALNSDDARLKGIKTGADDYIAKPFNTTILEARVNNLIASRKVLQEKFGKGLADDESEDILNYSTDKSFLEKSISLIDKHLNDRHFSVEEFSEELGLSRAQLYRKLKHITGQTVSEFIRAIRLRKAAKLIKESEMTINEIMYHVGFSSQSYFTKSFRGLYKLSPSEYYHKYNENEENE